MQGMPEAEFSLREFFAPLTTKKALVILLLIDFIVFFNILPNGFVYDDEAQITSNPYVHSLVNIPYFFLGGTFFDSGNNQFSGIYYKPVLSTIYTFTYALSGGYPFIFHLLQLSLHCINAFLLFLLFRTFFKEKRAIFFAIIFLVHPINQEAVAYISDLQDILFFFFGMLSMLILAKGQKSIKTIILLNIFLLLGLLSKETALLFVPLLCLYGYLFQKKQYNFPVLLSIFLTTAFYLYLHFFVAHLNKIPTANALIPIMHASFSERVMTIPAIITYYLQTFFFPVQLALGHEWVITSATFNSFSLPLILVVIFFTLIGYLGFTIRRSDKKAFFVYLFFVCWFVLGLLMHLQIIPLDATVADRWFYFPSVGLLGMIATIFQTNTYLNKMKYKTVATIGIVLIVILAGRTMIRNANWVNTLTLCQHDLPMVAGAYNVQSACGSQLLAVGRDEEAKKYFAKAAQLAPTYSFNWYQYGISYERTGDIAKAREYYRKSIQLSNEVNAYVSLAATYLKDNNPEQAKTIVEQGLRYYPHYQRLQLYLAVCEFKLNNKKAALEIATKEYQTSPSPEASYVLHQIANNEDVKLDN